MTMKSPTVLISTIVFLLAVPSSSTPWRPRNYAYDGRFDSPRKFDDNHHNEWIGGDTYMNIERIAEENGNHFNNPKGNDPEEWTRREFITDRAPIQNVGKKKRSVTERTKLEGVKGVIRRVNEKRNDENDVDVQVGHLPRSGDPDIKAKRADPDNLDIDVGDLALCDAYKIEYVTVTKTASTVTVYAPTATVYANAP